jgi:hypothetical protein
MQEKSYNDLLHSAFDESLDTPKKVKDKIRAISKENHHSSLGLKGVIRIPSEAELEFQAFSE